MAKTKVASENYFGILPPGGAPPQKRLNLGGNIRFVIFNLNSSKLKIMIIRLGRLELVGMIWDVNFI